MNVQIQSQNPSAARLARDICFRFACLCLHVMEEEMDVHVCTNSCSQRAARSCYRQYHARLQERRNKSETQSPDPQIMNKALASYPTVHGRYNQTNAGPHFSHTRVSGTLLKKCTAIRARITLPHAEGNFGLLRCCYVCMCGLIDAMQEQRCVKREEEIERDDFHGHSHA